MRILALSILLLSVPFNTTAQEPSTGDSCCRAMAMNMPVSALAVAVGTAGDKPLWVVPDDPTLLEFDLEGICIENLVNPLLQTGKVRALPCGDSFGLFGADLPPAQVSCDAVKAPAEVLPPGDLEGWTLTAVFTQRKGERLAVISGPGGEAHLLGSGMALASGGARLDGVGGQAVIVARSGIDTLDGSKPKMSVERLGEPAIPTCWVIEEDDVAATDEGEPAADAAAGEGEPDGGAPEAEAAGAPSEDGAAADPPADGASEEPVITYTCQDLEPDFVQRPLPGNICDDPAFRGTQIKVVVEFDETGWLRRLVSIEAEEGAVDALSAAIRDWRIVPVEVSEGSLARIRFAIEFPLEIPCR